MAELINHLWQSTLFTAPVAQSTLALRRNQAKLRYWFWLTASAKFLIPFSLLRSLGTRVPAPAVGPGISALAVEQLTSTFAPVPSMADLTFNGKVRQRLQALLMERFDLVLRAETREIPVYGLVIGKSGHKLNPTSEAKAPECEHRQRSDDGSGGGHEDALLRPCRPVAPPRRRLAGLYDLSMEWAPDSRPGDLTATDENGPSIFTAIQEQLGLRLDSPAFGELTPAQQA